ncbi:DUF1987 domain-containing protein [Microscilla marina]|uniref:SiaC family regulatory phosphoprotein domain-containing protein n=1 Tax=Microscilla marina ATCC 23134 TaxID=313606 RepID=A1ZPE5_MICM2|nr:DUF1987 domain-containing protein [Microscilla marina]EAY27684.1 conserved hypothetical protein [Microscilla marina ATCC 23134]
MDSLIIKSGKDTPFVCFDTNNNIFEISGESYSVLPNEFYEPVLQWLRNYLSTNRLPITLNIQFSYFNTSTYSPLCELLTTLERYQSNIGEEVTVNWFASQDDNEMINDAHFLKSSFCNLCFKVLPIQAAA